MQQPLHPLLFYDRLSSRASLFCEARDLGAPIRTGARKARILSPERPIVSSRRNFLRQSSLLAGGMLLGKSAAASAMMMPHAMPTQPNTLNVSTLPTFVDPLPIPAVAKPDGMRALPSSPKSNAPYYRFAARPVSMKIHRDLKPTNFWSFGPSVPGPTLEMRTDEDVLVEWANELPQQHFLPIDYRLHGAEGNPQVRIVSHLHGARVPAESDGFPKIGSCPASPCSITTLISRTRRRSGITITPWALIA